MKKLVVVLSIIFTVVLCFANASDQIQNYDTMKKNSVYSPQPAQTPVQSLTNYTIERNDGKDPFQDLVVPLDGTFTQALGPNDDGYTDAIALPFTFYLYGTPYTSFWINNNGNVTFDMGYSSYTPWGFPINGAPMLAPFFADVDTRGAGSGYVWYKIEANRVIVTWDHVGYYSAGVDRLNTFQVIFSDGTDPQIGLGNNVAFSYGDLAWTTGSASGGSGGLGGTPATVGVNAGDGVLFSQTGRFDHEGYDYDGAYDNNDGIDWLDWVIFYYDVADPAATLTIIPTTVDNGMFDVGLPGDVVPADPDLSVFYASYPIAGTLDVYLPVGAGTWRAWAWYNAQWNQADVFPYVGPGTIVFSDVPFGAKADIPIVVDGDEVTLPVELSSFTAVLTAQNYVKLAWITQSETGVNGYNIYRANENTLTTAQLISPMITATNTSTQQNYDFTDAELYEEGTYYYWLQSVEMDGSSAFFGPVSVEFTMDDDGEGNPSIPVHTVLMNAFPNPFNPTTNLRYSLREAGSVNLEIFNARGQLVRSFRVSQDNPGYYTQVWDGTDFNGRNLTSGVYLCRMTSGDNVSSVKLLLSK